MNGTDGLGKSLIDAYALPLASVYVTAPRDQTRVERPEYPTIATTWDRNTDNRMPKVFMKEPEWVAIHSSSCTHGDIAVVGDVVVGKRSRVSFAPMVITGGQRTCCDAINAISGRRRGADNRGYFFNPCTTRVRRPKPAAVAALMRPLVRCFLNRLIQ